MKQALCAAVVAIIAAFGGAAAAQSPVGFGGGAAYSWSVSGKRIQKTSISQLSDGTVQVKIEDDDDAAARFIGEIHHTAKPSGPQQIFLCGPMAVFRQECGPFAALAADTTTVQEVGVGWMAQFGRFGLGLGVLFDPEVAELDTSVVDPKTLLVRPTHQANVLSGQTGVLTSTSGTAVMLMIVYELK